MLPSARSSGRLPDPGSADFVPLSVEETLVAVSLVGPGAEAIRLLDSLRGQVLTEDQRLTVVQLWQAQKSWLAGAEQAAVYRFAPLPDPADAEGGAGGGVRAPRAGAGVAHLDRPGQGPDRGSPRAARPVQGDRGPAPRRAARPVPGVADRQGAGHLVAGGGGAGAGGGAAERRVADPVPAAAGVEEGRRRAADPEWNARMFARTRKRRQVGFDAEAEQGLVRMWADLPPVEGLAVQQALEAAAGKFDPADGRDHDERMADALIAAVIGSEDDQPKSNQPVKPQVTVQVLVPLPTLLGLRDDTAELRGYGTIPAEVARELAADADWQRWTYDPVDGHLLDLGRTRYRPTGTTPAVPDRPRPTRPVPGISRQRRELRRRPHRSLRPDRARPRRDHVRRRDGHAVAEHRTGPRPTPTSSSRHDPDGTLTWTTPLGRQYTTRPWDYRPLSEQA